MNNLRILAIVSLAALTLAGCGKKPSYHDAAQQTQKPAQTEPASPPSPSAAAPAQSACTSLPDKLAIQRGIQNAMKQIYGVDEAPAKFVVLRVDPASDCEHAGVTYRSQTAGAASQTAQISSDGGKWSVTLFNKPYPVE